MRSSTPVHRLRFTVIPLLLCAALNAQRPAAAIIAGLAPLDLDGDGIAEIESLDSLDDMGRAEAPRVMVLVESRLLESTSGVSAAAIAGLRERLRRHAADLDHEGFAVSVVRAKVHAGPPHQDGRTLLGLRRVLRAVRAESPLVAAVLVGHFPDALLVRTCNWRRSGAVELPGRDGKPIAFSAGTSWLRSVPEFVADRCDLVLADLDGGWEAVHVPGPAVLPAVTAVFGDGATAGGGACLGIKEGGLQVTDVFHLQDGTARIDREAFAVTIDDDDRDHECSAADKLLGNALAHPEIAVSRIDARGVALQPPARFLDVAGHPQPVLLAEGEDAAAALEWSRDPTLEVRLLTEYFDRNHAFRTAPAPDAAHRPTSISWGLGSGLGSLLTAQSKWRGVVDADCDVKHGVDLLALLGWFQRPAVVRTLRAHSNALVAAFAKTDVKALEATIGGPAWAWRKKGHSLVPSLAECASGRADYGFYRTLWEDHVLPEQPFLLVHTGCEAISPPGAHRLPFDADGYGLRAQAESILFFTPCLAMVGRAKVFYDEPRGFSEALAAGATFGAAWQRYFEIEGASANWGKVGGDIGRKRACFWSVVGDCTLRLLP